jgi:hypothetical protein
MTIDVAGAVRRGNRVDMATNVWDVCFSFLRCLFLHVNLYWIRARSVVRFGRGPDMNNRAVLRLELVLVILYIRGEYVSLGCVTVC